MHGESESEVGAPVGGWSPDGRLLLVLADDETARVLDVVTGVEVSRLKGHKAPAGSSSTEATWSSNGSKAATFGNDKTVPLWDAGTGPAIATVVGHTRWFSSVVWSPGGSRLLTTQSDGTTRIDDAWAGAQVPNLKVEKGVTVR